MELRPYQIGLIDRVRDEMRSGSKRILVQSPTGSGKTVLMAWMVKEAMKRGFRCLFLTHRRELVQQTYKTFVDMGVLSTTLTAGGHYRESMSTIGSVQTVARRSIPPMDLIIYDECHHIAAGSWAKIQGDHTDAFHIGLTATPARLDGQGLIGYFDKMVLGPSVAQLIHAGYLSNYRLFAPYNVDLKGVKTRLGDWVRGELNAAVDKPRITGNVISEYKKRCYGKRAIVFCVSVEHSRHVAAEFVANGVNAKSIDGGMDDGERDRTIREFRDGSIQVLCNCDLVGEGFDVPGIECAILLRPTQSLSLYLQQVGRALRPSAGKSEAIILDHVGNSTRHGLPDDQREWSLDGIKGNGKAKNRTDAVRICEGCFAANRFNATICDCCGKPFSVEGRKVETVDGELAEIDLEQQRNLRRARQGQCRTYPELIAEGKARGYKNPAGWAYHILRSRGQL